MLKHLEIKNYALIEHIELDFEKGLVIITGETGAGKSILLGGMELILGKRAQQGLLKNKEKKSIVEGQFAIKNYHLQEFFDHNMLDYEEDTYIRRELLPGGKSRAFINDTPVKLETLSALSKKLIDIHSQHQTLELNNKEFQFELVDAVANTHHDLQEFKKKLKNFRSLEQEIESLQQKLQTAEEELQYKSFQLDELEEAKLDQIEPEELEERLKLLENAEEIGSIINEAISRIDDEQIGVHQQLIELRNQFNRIRQYGKAFEEIADRLESVQIELADISMEIGSMAGDIEFDPLEKERLQQSFDEFHRLLIKHKASSLSELIELREQLAAEVSDLSDLENAISKLEDKKQKLQNQLTDLALNIRKKRKKAIPSLVQQIEEILSELSMKDTKIKIEISASDEFKSNGMDNLDFLISSNKGKSFGEIKQIASGGELSRIMLAVKTVLSKYKKLPSIIFDEIDTGISGEVAQNMASVLKELSRNMQVIVITHLPQIAAAGDLHYKVYKESTGEVTTHVKKLDNNERILEIAEMIEGKNPSASAIQHAEFLLG